jgi:hypothetical protein
LRQHARFLRCHRRNGSHRSAGMIRARAVQVGSTSAVAARSSDLETTPEHSSSGSPHRRRCRNHHLHRRPAPARSRWQPLPLLLDQTLSRPAREPLGGFRRFTLPAVGRTSFRRPRPPTTRRFRPSKRRTAPEGRSVPNFESVIGNNTDAGVPITPWAAWTPDSRTTAEKLVRPSQR